MATKKQLATYRRAAKSHYRHLGPVGEGAIADSLAYSTAKGHADGIEYWSGVADAWKEMLAKWANRV